jgi:DnaJ like chaperone protein
VISVATVDGLLDEKELKIIRGTASILGFSSIIFEHMLRMISAQDRIYRATENAKTTNSTGNTHGKNKTEFKDQRPPNQAELLEAAYSALGISMEADEAEVKKVYRKLVSQYHPDKIEGQGLPPEFINAANEYFKRIHAAYEYIANH